MSGERSRLKPTVDVYPVGLLSDVKYYGVVNGFQRARRVCRGVVAGRNWRRLRSYLNGYLAEHVWPCQHDAGRGWTKSAALRRADRICRGGPR
jgi:hypothetical protein